MWQLLENSRPLLGWLLTASFQASVLVVLILLARWALRRRLSPAWRCGLWLLVILRLLLPAGPSSRLSLFNVVRPQAISLASAPASPQETAAVPAIPVALQAARELPAVIPQLPPRAPVAAAAPAELKVAVGGDPDPQAAEAGAFEPAGGAPVIATVSPIAAPPPAAPRHSAWQWAQLGLAAAWLAGAAALLARMAVASVLLPLRLRRCSAPAEERVQRLLDLCRKQIGIRRRLPVLGTSAVASPALAGVLRPRILLPAGMGEALSDQELRFVLLHELAHLRRLDVPANWLMSAVTALHWFNPLVWLAFARMRADRELACDAMVLARTPGGQRLDYGRTIVKLLERIRSRQAVPGAIGVLEDGRLIQRRILMIASFDRPVRSWSIVGVVLLGVLAVAALTNAKADDKSPAPGKGAAPPAAQPAPPTALPAAPDASSAAEALIRAKLQAQTNVNFPQVEFAKVVDWMKDVGGLNIVVNWPALKAAGLAPETMQVDLALKSVTLDKALRLALDQVAGGATELGYVIEDGVVLISTRDDLRRKTVTKVYDVRDLVAGEYPPADVSARPNDFAEALSTLIQTLQENVDAPSWRPVGTVGSVRPVSGQLVVTQTIDNQGAVLALLDALRQSRIPAWKREIYLKLQATVKKVDFSIVEFAKAVDWLKKDVGGVNIAVDPKIDVKALPPISLSVQNVTVEQALSMVTRMAGLQWRTLDGAVYIAKDFPARPPASPVAGGLGGGQGPSGTDAFAAPGGDVEWAERVRTLKAMEGELDRQKAANIELSKKNEQLANEIDALKAKLSSGTPGLTPSTAPSR